MKSMKFFKRPSTSSTSLEPLQGSENSGPDELAEVHLFKANNNHFLKVPRSPRERSLSLTRLGEMPKLSKVMRSASDVSLASTVALEDSLLTIPSGGEIDLSRQNEIEETRNFVRKQKRKLPVLLDSYVDFIGHQIVGVLNTVVRYKDVTEEARASRVDDRTVKGETSFYFNVIYNILPAFQDLVSHINSYSRASVRDIDERKFLCQQTKKKVDHIHKLIVFLMETDLSVGNASKRWTLNTTTQNCFLQYQMQVRQSMLNFERIYKVAEDIYRLIGVN